MSKIVREIRFHRDSSYEGNTEWLNAQLEEGRQLRESKLNELDPWHIPCKMEWASEKIGTPGTPPSQDANVIIPHDGIDEIGYVKEVWIECIESIGVDTVDLYGITYRIINPDIHNNGRWIRGFKTKGDGIINLLPSPEIVVKYITKHIT